MDFVAKVFKGKELLCVIGADNFLYDDVCVSTLNELIDSMSNKDINKDSLLSVLPNIGYFYEAKEFDDYKYSVIDFENKFVSGINEISVYTDANALLKENEIITKEEIIDINFEYPELLLKNALSFDELRVLEGYLNEMIKTFELAFCVNQKFFVRLNYGA